MCLLILQDRKFIASEPMPDFINTLRKQCPSIDARQFSGESIPLPNDSVQVKNNSTILVFTKTNSRRASGYKIIQENT